RNFITKGDNYLEKRRYSPISFTVIRISGRSAVCGQTCCRDQRQYDDFCRTLFCPEAVLFCQQQRLCHGPAGVRQFHYQLRVSRRADQISGGSGARADFLLGIGKSAAYKLF
ncbi:hypothetical protein P2O70_22540, partial [Escherichia coli]